VALLAPLLGACMTSEDPLGVERRRVLAPGATDAGASPAPPAAMPVDAGVQDAAPAAAAETPVSDLDLEVVANGFGPLEKNASNGEVLAGDGNPLTLNGVVYAKGLGVHASSEVNVSLAGQYKTFLADLGLDDEVGETGSVVFKVIVDGVEVFDSGVLTGASATKSVSVDVTGKLQLKLVVTDGGDTVDFDHADWAGARLAK
jgi:hypothetical protein